MKRRKLSLPQNYVSNLEWLLGLELSPDAIISKKGRKALEPYVHAVSELSLGLTKTKDKLIKQKYLHDDDLRHAYMLYFTTTNFLKVIQPLHEWLPYFKGDTIRVLDLGCGTGAATWGLLEYLTSYSHGNVNLEITFADHVKANLEICKKFISHYEDKPKYTTVHVDLNNPDDVSVKFKDTQFDLIIMMNALNELQTTADILSTIDSHCDDNGAILIIEPASKNESRRLLTLRDDAKKNGFTIYSPCTHQMNCPALHKEDDWCFNEIGWERPAFIRYIDDMVGNLRLSLKYSYIVLTKNGQTMQGNMALSSPSRVVSEVFHEKGRTRAVICDQNGRGEHTLNTRDKSSSNKAFIEIERFDVLALTNIEPREHDTRIQESSEVTIVLPILGA